MRRASGPQLEVLSPLGELLSTLSQEVMTLRERLEEMERRVQHLALPSTLLSVQEMVARHPGLTFGSLKWLLFNRRENGLDALVVQSGRKVLIDEPKFLDWLAKRPDSRTSQPSGPRRPPGVAR
jgi:hypothetical protein